jgi:hypothetical protein
MRHSSGRQEAYSIVLPLTCMSGSQTAKGVGPKIIRCHDHVHAAPVTRSRSVGCKLGRRLEVQTQFTLQLRICLSAFPLISISMCLSFSDDKWREVMHDNERGKPIR